MRKVRTIMTAEKKHRRTLLLDDVPASEDEFASDGSPGPHQRVADAIVELISSPDEKGGKIIGLEGGWGSGKSTVVRFIRNRLVELGHVPIYGAYQKLVDRLAANDQSISIDLQRKISSPKKTHADRGGDRGRPDFSYHGNQSFQAPGK